MTLFYISRAFFEQAHADGSAESSGGKSLNLFYISRAFFEQAHADGSVESSGCMSLNLSHISRAFPTRCILMCTLCRDFLRQFFELISYFPRFSEQAHADGSAESSGGKSLNLSNISRAFPTRRMLMGVYRHLAANL